MQTLQADRTEFQGKMPVAFEVNQRSAEDHGFSAPRLEWNHGGARNSGKIEESVAYMRQHLTEPLRISTLAAVARMSEPHYFASFKRHTGFTPPLDFFIRLRMQHACRLLADTALSVKEVASELGYDDPFYFSRIFKSVLEVAPSDYRAAEWSRPEAR